jgi:hypothetical protein
MFHPRKVQIHDEGLMTELEISLFLLRRLLGVKTDDKKQTKVCALPFRVLYLPAERVPFEKGPKINKK